jgi:hypothetical protein
MSPQAEHLTCQNTSTGQQAQALDRLSQARFATQSATHFDLASSNRLLSKPGLRNQPRKSGLRNQPRLKKWMRPSPHSPSQPRSTASTRLCQLLRRSEQEGPIRSSGGWTEALRGPWRQASRVPGVTIRCDRTCPGSSLAKAALTGRSAQSGPGRATCRRKTAISFPSTWISASFGHHPAPGVNGLASTVGGRASHRGIPVRWRACGLNRMSGTMRHGGLARRAIVAVAGIIVRHCGRTPWLRQYRVSFRLFWPCWLSQSAAN